MGSFRRLDGVERYFSAVEAEWPERNVGNLRFYLSHIFDGVTLDGARVLDVGAGDGLYSLYAAAAGAERVVALEPEADGAGPRVRERFESLAGRLGLDSVELSPVRFHEFDGGGERFDVLFLRSSINHLDEEATKALHRDAAARRVYLELLAKLALMSAEGAKLVVADCTRHNLFARLGVTNPLQPTVEWDKHQPPETWVGLLEEVGFAEPRVRWSSLNTLRGPGRAVLGNRFANWFTLGSFCITMTFRQPAIVTA